MITTMRRKYFRIRERTINIRTQTRWKELIKHLRQARQEKKEVCNYFMPKNSNLHSGYCNSSR